MKTYIVIYNKNSRGKNYSKKDLEIIKLIGSKVLMNSIMIQIYFLLMNFLMHYQ